jgi:hypothetical protein
VLKVLINKFKNINKMIRTISLNQLIDAVDSNLPAGTIILDPSGNSITFYKYKGTLVERDSLEFNQPRLRSAINHSVKNGSTLAIKIHAEDDISSFITRETISPELFNRAKITNQVLDTYQANRDDFVILHNDFRFVFIVKSNVIPNCLQVYIDQRDLVPIQII